MNDSLVPLYIKLRETLARKIKEGVLIPHEKLPSERELTETYEINRMTVRQALKQLESGGLIYRSVRRGWYVTPQRLFYDPTQNERFMDNVRSQGRKPETVMLSKNEISDPGESYSHLDIETGAPIYQIRRRRLIDGHSVLVENMSINAKLCPGLLNQPLEGSLTAVILEKYGIRITRTSVDMYPAPLGEAEAKELQVVAGTPCLYLSRTSYDQHGNVVEYDQEFWRHDVLQISIEVNVDQDAEERRLNQSSLTTPALTSARDQNT